jgi:hypothetical protein
MRDASITDNARRGVPQSVSGQNDSHPPSRRAGQPAGASCAHRIAATPLIESTDGAFQSERVQGRRANPVRTSAIRKAPLGIPRLCYIVASTNSTSAGRSSHGVFKHMERTLHKGSPTRRPGALRNLPIGDPAIQGDSRFSLPPWQTG